MRPRAVLVFLIGVLTLLAGCASNADTNVKSSAQSSVDAGTGTGRIEGLVVTLEELPIPGVSALVAGLGDLNGTKYELQTDEDGRFRLEGLVGGDYLVSVGRLGYSSAPAQTVNVVEGETRDVTFHLEEILPPEPFSSSIHSRLQTLSFACAKGVPEVGGRNLSGCSGLYFIGNWTFMYDNDEGTSVAPLQTLIAEARWQPSLPGCKVGLVHSVFSPDKEDPFVGNESDPYYWTSLPNIQSPTRVVVQREGDASAMLSPERTQLNGGKPLKLEGPWRVVTVWEVAGIAGTPVDVDCSINQSFDLWVTVFHGEPAPADWSFFESEG